MSSDASRPSALVLVVDDDKMMRLLLRRAMEREGYQVAEARNGEECLNAYQQLHPNVILLDAMMPVMDGFTCCTQLQQMIAHDQRRDPSRKQTLILMITGLEDSESVNFAFEVGAVDYVTKPINWAVLCQRVRRLIQQVELYQQLQDANHKLERLALLDSLTQVANRRRFDEYLVQEWSRMARERACLALIMADVDCFKSYNDTYGHFMGDACLQKVAKALDQASRRPADFIARYGGEEFALILPDTDVAGALQVAENVRTEVKALQIPHAGSTVSDYVTVSLGIAAKIPDHATSPEVLIIGADKALYEAKSQGRDRCCALTDMPQ